MARITNHRNAPVHLPSPVKMEPGKPAGKKLTLEPGVNHIDDDVWDKVKGHPMTKAFLDDEHIEINGKVNKETIPTLKDFVEAGYNPENYPKRFPGVKILEDDMNAAIEIYKADQAAKAASKKGGGPQKPVIDHDSGKS